MRQEESSTLPEDASVFAIHPNARWLLTFKRLVNFCGRGLLWSTSWLNVCTFCCVGGACSRCCGGVLGVIRACFGESGGVQDVFYVRNGSG